MSAWYCTRESVKAAVDVKDTARANAQIDRLIEDASRSAEELCHRTFYPQLDTRYFDWPDRNSPTSWRLWLGQHEVVSVDEVTSAGVALDPSDYLLEPSADGPPYDRIEMNRAGTGSFTSGNTPQRNIGVTGLFMGARLTERLVCTADAIDALEDDLDVSDGSNVGVGSVLRIDEERVIVTDRRPLNLGVTLASALIDKKNDVVVSLSASAADLQPGEVLLIDGERMTVVDVTGSACTVTRADDGSVLAEHDLGASVYSFRTLRVSRGALGTVSAVHGALSPVLAWVPHGTVQTYTVAEVINSLAQENSGYVRVIGSGEGTRNASGAGLQDIRDRLYRTLARKVRTGAI